mmetsp:Transcript_3892/g.7778  ORF Transcript_3892/g.7778 Transcript_3892/m.7778 type:complete len:235 (-) Transcript_3892:142-846(-)
MPPLRFRFRTPSRSSMTLTLPWRRLLPLMTEILRTNFKRNHWRLFSKMYHRDTKSEMPVISSSTGRIAFAKVIIIAAPEILRIAMHQFTFRPTDQFHCNGNCTIVASSGKMATATKCDGASALFLESMTSSRTLRFLPTIWAVGIHRTKAPDRRVVVNGILPWHISTIGWKSRSLTRILENRQWMDGGRVTVGDRFRRQRESEVSRIVHVACGIVFTGLRNDGLGMLVRSDRRQ